MYLHEINGEFFVKCKGYIDYDDNVYYLPIYMTMMNQQGNIFSFPFLLFNNTRYINKNQTVIRLHVFQPFYLYSERKNK